MEREARDAVIKLYVKAPVFEVVVVVALDGC